MNRSCFSSFCPGIGAGIAGGNQAYSCWLWTGSLGHWGCFAPCGIHFIECRVELRKNVGVYAHGLQRILVDSGFCTGVRVKSFFPALLFVRA